MLGQAGLEARFKLEIQSFDDEEQRLLFKAFELAKHLHRDDSRQREPYICHPLRVAIRLMAHYHIADSDIVVACLLHDSVEDHPDEIAPAAEGDIQSAALEVLARDYNPRVASLVKAVTNPVFSPDKDKNTQYLAHATKLMTTGDPGAVMIKVSDFTDNAIGIIYTTGEKVPRLGAKYLPLIKVFRTALQRKDLPISPEVRHHIERQLDLGQERLQATLVPGSSV